MLKSVTEYLDASYLKFPDKVAFADEHSSLTYAQLRANARSIATILVKDGFFKQAVIILLDTRSTRCVAAFLGTAYSGNFYVPLDFDTPAARVQKIIDTTEPVVIITDAKHDNLLKNLNYDAKVFCYDDIILEKVDDKILSDIEVKQIDTDLLYVFFTSGSTGTPKGVCVCHRSVIDYIEQITKILPVSVDTIWGNQSGLHFDKTTKELYSALKIGFTVVFIPKQMFSFPVELIEYMNKQHISAIDWVPSIYNFVAIRRVLTKFRPLYLKSAHFSGEVMTNKTLNIWRKHLPDVTYINVYGPTEITGTCSYYVVDKEFVDEEPLPIGKPYNNTSILVLNEKDDLVSGDEVGELCVRGASLALGYYNNTEKTAEVFVQNPLNKAYPELIYRTGDLARYNERGELIYVGRKDFQIKHLGNRIELGEIEANAIAIDGVDTCACAYDSAKQRIVLFYSGSAETKILRDTLKTKLQPYMVPGVLTQLEVMPLNANGKIDRQKLKALI